MVLIPAKFFQQFFVPITALLCLISIISLQRSALNAVNQNISKAEYVQQEQAEAANVKLLRQIPSFGFNNVIANWTFLQFIQYFGDTPARDQTGYSLVPEYFEIIVDRDPQFVPAYLFMSAASSIFAARPDRTVAIMNRGLKSLTPEISPAAYYVWLYKGVDELLFLGNHQAAQYSYKVAAQWASLQGNQVIATNAQQTASFLAQNPNSKRAQASAWLSILSNATDDRVKQLALQKIRAVGGKITTTYRGGAIQFSVEMPKED
jgi:hypothetical protein